MSQSIRKILVIRIRHIGDSVLSIPLCSTLKRSFPNAEVHYLVNENIAPLYDHHPDMDEVIALKEKESHSFLRYVIRVRSIVKANHYDVIIDLRSTFSTLLFSLLSLNSRYRIGRKKKYSGLFLTHATDYQKDASLSMLQQDFFLLHPLEKEARIQYVTEFRLYNTSQEKAVVYERMKNKGVTFTQPIFLIGVTTRLPSKQWRRDYIKIIIKKLMDQYPSAQLIFNYAPTEEQDARSFYEELGSPSSIIIDLPTRSLRDLVALCSFCSFYFGNEGGTRHIAHAVEVPSFVVWHPEGDKAFWLPRNSIPAEAMVYQDVLTREQWEPMTRQERYDSITPEKVWDPLKRMIDNLVEEKKLKYYER